MKRYTVNVYDEDGRLLVCEKLLEDESENALAQSVGSVAMHAAKLSLDDNLGRVELVLDDQYEDRRLP